MTRTECFCIMQFIAQLVAVQLMDQEVTGKSIENQTSPVIQYECVRKLIIIVRVTWVGKVRAFILLNCNWNTVCYIKDEQLTTGYNPC